MDKLKPINTMFATYFKSITNQSPSTRKEKEDMYKVSYASTISSLMHAMVCICLNIIHVVGLVNRFLSNPGKEH